MKLAADRDGKKYTSELSGEQQQALALIDKLHATLARAGDASEVSSWEDQLVNGRKTFVSELADTQTDHFFGGKTHTTQDLMSAAEHLSEQDWQMLRKHADPNDQEWTDVRNSLKTYATPEEQNRVVEMLQRKAAADSFEDSQPMRRSFAEVAADNTNGKHVNSGGEVNIVNAITSMSPEDAKKYHDDPSFKTFVDSTVTDKLSPPQTRFHRHPAETEAADSPEQLYAKALLKQIDATGAPPNLTPELQILSDKINGASQVDSISHIKEALRDPASRERLAQSSAPLDQQIQKVIYDQISDMAPTYSKNPSLNSKIRSDAYAELMKTGKLPLNMELQHELLNGHSLSPNLYKDLAAASPDEQKIALDRLNPDENAIAHNVMTQGGKVEAVDEMRIFAIGGEIDQSQVKRDLTGANILSLSNQYSEKYHSDAATDVIQKANGDSQTDFKRLFTTAPSDAAQSAFDHARASESGLVADGTRLALHRADQELFNSVERANENHAQLSQQDTDRLNKYADNARQQYNDSKKALADSAADGALVVGSVAAVPFTGGVSLAGLSIAAGVGAGIDVGTHALIQGTDTMSGGQIALDAASGSLMMVSNFGGDAAAGVLGIGKKVSAKLAKDVAQNAEKITGAEDGLIDNAKRARLSNETTKTEDSAPHSEQMDAVTNSRDKLPSTPPERVALETPVLATSTDEVVSKFKSLFDDPAYQQADKKAQANMIEKSINEMLGDLGLPSVSLRPVEESQLMSGAHAGDYDNADGTFSLHPALLQSRAEAKLVGTIAHELTHHEQTFLELSQLADELKIGTQATEAQKDELIARYKNLFADDDKVDPQFVDRMLQARHGQKLSAKESERADNLIKAFQEFKKSPMSKPTDAKSMLDFLDQYMNSEWEKEAYATGDRTEDAYRAQHGGDKSSEIFERYDREKLQEQAAETKPISTAKPSEYDAKGADQSIVEAGTGPDTEHTFEDRNGNVITRSIDGRISSLQLPNKDSYKLLADGTYNLQTADGHVIPNYHLLETDSGDILKFYRDKDNRIAYLQTNDGFYMRLGDGTYARQFADEPLVMGLQLNETTDGSITIENPSTNQNMQLKAKDNYYQ